MSGMRKKKATPLPKSASKGKFPKAPPKQPSPKNGGAAGGVVLVRDTHQEARQQVVYPNSPRAGVRVSRPRKATRPGRSPHSRGTPTKHGQAIVTATASERAPGGPGPRGDRNASTSPNQKKYHHQQQQQQQLSSGHAHRKAVSPGFYPSPRHHNKQGSHAAGGGTGKGQPRSPSPARPASESERPTELPTAATTTANTTALLQQQQLQNAPSPPSSALSTTASTQPQLQQVAPPRDEDKTVKESQKGKGGGGGGRDPDERQMAKLRNFVDNTLKLGIEGMETQWRLVKDHLPVAATRMDFDANPGKNRFQDMVCIDQTRVFLEQTHSDYIHASWVAVGEDRKAIVTQLPVPSAAPDFWEMCLQNEVQGILLILSPAEYGRFGAEHVFPSKGDFIHYRNHLKVGCVKRVEVAANWSLSVYTIKHGHRQRYVHVHHYSDWLHNGRPGKMEEMWQLEAIFRRYRHPHVYMSLSGGGRAGTFAAFQLAHWRLHSAKVEAVSIPSCITATRNFRMHAVQSAVQMQFLYLAITKHIFSMQSVDAILPEKESKFSRFLQLLTKYAQRDQLQMNRLGDGFF
ncbi:unnamed protein product, partial [Mesorhabditis spiculigera]